VPVNLSLGFELLFHAFSFDSCDFLAGLLDFDVDGIILLTDRTLQLSAILLPHHVELRHDVSLLFSHELLIMEFLCLVILKPR